MSTEMGEYIVGAYLKIINGCDFVDYNVRRIEGGMRGLNEIDVLGLNFEKRIAYLCEVMTHIRGLQADLLRIKKKYKSQQAYAEEYLIHFRCHHFMFWSPIVPEGHNTEGLRKINGLELIINDKYTSCINELRQKAKIMSNDTGNPFFRVLQILERLRG